MNRLDFKDIATIGAIIAGFVLLIALSITYAQLRLVSAGACSCVLPITLLIAALASFGVIVGVSIYYLLTRKLSEHPAVEEKKELAEALLKLVKPEERKVLKVLIEEDGITQADIAKRTAMSRVALTRTLQKLEGKGIVKREAKGKTKLVYLTPEMKGVRHTIHYP
jgi:uncharacterized membrane protein